ncbi:MAG: amino acid permease [Bacteroidales bacterium]
MPPPVNMSGLRSGAWTGKAIFYFVCCRPVDYHYCRTYHKPSPGRRLHELPGAGQRYSNPLFILYGYACRILQAYQGWVSVRFIGGEITNARRNIPKGIAIGVVVVIAVYMLVNLAYMRIMSIPDLVGVHEAGNQIAAVEAIQVFRDWRIAVYLGADVHYYNGLSQCQHSYRGSRPYYAMSQRLFLFRNQVSLTGTAFRSSSLLWQGIWASVLVLSRHLRPTD